MPLPSERKEVAVDPAVLAGYAGTYELMPGASIVLSVEFVKEESGVVRLTFRQGGQEMRAIRK